MTKFLKLLSLVLFISFSQLSAQVKQQEMKTFKFGKVEPSDFTAKIEGADSAAAAIKLFDTGYGHFEISSSSGKFVYVFERHVRYKVVNKNGYDLANLEISLFNNNKGSEEKLDRIKGATYNLVNNQIETSKMTSEARFSSKRDKNHITKKFTLPNVKEGSVIEYSYTTKSDFIFKLDDWYFQDSYPCKYSSFTLMVPEYYRYKILLGGYLQVQALQPQEVVEMYSIPSTNTSNAQKVNGTALKNQYYAENIPAIKSEKYITTLEDYVSKIGFELTSTNFPGSGFTDYTSTWAKVVGEIIKDDSFGGFLNRDNYPRGTVEGIIKGAKDPKQKMELIFKYVKNTIKWDNTYSWYTLAANQRAVLERKSGNSAEINLILMNLLRSAGITAAPVLISTRRNGMHPGYPLVTKFNNVIVEADIEGSKHLLDATDKDNKVDLIGYQNLNHQGLRLDLSAVQAEWIAIQNNTLSKENAMYNLKLGTDNRLSGNIYLSSTNYEELARRDTYAGLAGEKEYLKAYLSDKAGMEISSFQLSNGDNAEEPLMENMEVTINDKMEDAGNLVYFMPLLYERIQDNPFSLEERYFPVDFAYPFEKNYRLILDFPESYTLEKLPKSQVFKLPGDEGSFSITYVAKDHQIAVISKIRISKAVFSADEYFTLKELYKNIVQKQAEQIVFKKS